MNAAGADYSPNAVDITFPVDEFGDLHLTRNVDIPITDDNINEADREYFILHLSLTSNALPGLELGTVVSAGGINDDDSKSCTVCVGIKSRRNYYIQVTKTLTM